MIDTNVAAALRSLGQQADGPIVELAGSMSQSGVYQARINGRDCVLKITTAAEEQDLVRRELAFYQTLAGHVPVLTPRLLDTIDTAELTALVLTVHRPTPPAREWDDSAWIEVARQLAQLHEFRVPDSPPWDSVPWLRQVVDEPPVEVAEAFWSGTSAREDVAAVLDNPGALASALDAVPASFIHGDCHVGNLLNEDSKIIWADWTVAGHGTPAIDLAHLCTRAYSDSANPPYVKMLREYTDLRGLDHRDFHRSMLAAELATLLFGWPHFASYHSTDEQRQTTQHLIDRISDWRRAGA